MLYFIRQGTNKLRLQMYNFKMHSFIGVTFIMVTVLDTSPPQKKKNK